MRLYSKPVKIGVEVWVHTLYSNVFGLLCKKSCPKLGIDVYIFKSSTGKNIHIEITVWA